MERKIGEIFEYNGEWYQCVEETWCYQYVFEVVFKKLEKVGEPYIRWLSPSNNIMVQRYRLYGRNVIMPDEPYMYFNAIDNTIEIEIKQTEEDMEEKKLNLKPFDIQKAKEGKPVCTRDGRKARIICFDKTKDIYPIIALISDKEEYEQIVMYMTDGTNSLEHPENDLMMLPEKKEGWVNVYNSLGVVTFSHNPYDTKKEALANAKPKYYVDTVKINWEE